MLNDPKKAGRITTGLVSALYLATAVLLGLLLYFTVKSIQQSESTPLNAQLHEPIKSDFGAPLLSEHIWQTAAPTSNIPPTELI